MLVLTRTHTRPNTKTPFFLQLVTDPRPWDLYQLYINLKSRIKIFDERFSKDVLTKIVIFEFADQECYDIWKSHPHNLIRTQSLLFYNSSKFITMTDVLTEMDDASDYYNDIASRYFSSTNFKLARVAGDTPDVFTGDASVINPSDDPIGLNPWFETLTIS